MKIRLKKNNIQDNELCLENYGKYVCMREISIGLSFLLEPYTCNAKKKCYFCEGSEFRDENEDVDDLVDEHNEEITTEDLQDFLLEVQQTDEEVASHEQDETDENILSSEIKDICS